ncbi:RICIN domain-containing protein [Actinoplanes sp. G11-F43]|uniref:RICIN domain-containing protein n=1 Tax=Actinoplanes sp. G11-F43 TaxID=3424130 RepID=UPI003D33177D
MTLITSPAVAVTPAVPAPAPTASSAPGTPATAARQAAPSPADTPAAAAAAVAADPIEDDGLPTSIPDKIKAAREISIEPGNDWLNQSDRNFVFKIWQHTAGQPLIRNAAELALSAPDSTIDYVCKTFILQGIFDAKVADDAKQISDDTAARQARELKRAAYAAAKVPLDQAGEMLVYPEHQVIAEILAKAPGARVRAAATTAYNGTAEERHAFLATGVQTAADQDVQDAIAAAEAEGAAAQARIAREGTLRAAAAVLGVLADEGKLAMTDDNFVRWIWDLTDGDTRRTEIATAARTAVRNSDPAAWRAFIETGIYTANKDDRDRLEAEAEAADRRNAESIRTKARTDGFDNLVTAATWALAVPGPDVVNDFVRTGRNRVAPDTDNRPSRQSWQWRNQNSEKCLAAAGDSVTVGSLLVQANCVDSDRQRWIAMRVYNTPDRYRIVNANDRTKCAALSTRTAANNIRFAIATCSITEVADQTFKYTKTDDKYTWINTFAGRAITVQNASRDHGAATLTFDVNGGNNQLWLPTNTRLLVDQELSDAKFLLSHNGYMTRLQGDGNLVLTKGGQPLWSTRVTTGVRLVNQSDGNLVLRKADGVAVWASNTYGKGPSTLKMQPDGNLVLYRNSDNVATWSTATYHYTLVSKWNSKCVNVPGTTFTDSTQLEMRTCNGGSLFQGWQYDEATKRFISFEGKCMDARNSGKTSGTVLQIYTCNTSNAQKFEYYTDNSWRNVNSGLCIDIPSNNRNDGAKLTTWTCNGGTNQKW